MKHPLAEGLRSADPDERRAACLAVVDDPSATLLLDALGQALGDPAKAVARAASDALAALGRRDPAVGGVLRTALRDGDPRRRFGAAFTLARLAPPTPALIPALVEAMSGPDGDVRWAAAKLLVETGRAHGEVLPVLLGLARKADDPSCRRMSTYCLRELAPDRPEAARILLEATFDDDRGVRRAAFTALAALIDPPTPVRARLCACLADDPDPAVRRIAAVALGELGAADPGSIGAEARRALRAASESAQDPDLERAARRALERLGPEAGR